jgi:hypothetical protein
VRQEIAYAWRFRKTMLPILLEGFAESSEDLKIGCVKQLLRFDGERILDQQNIFVPEALSRIARRVRSGLSALYAGTKEGPDLEASRPD